MRPHEVLGISSTASDEEAKQAYRKLAKQYHPDKPGGNRKKFETVKQAYERFSKRESNPFWNRNRKKRNQVVKVNIGLLDIMENKEKEIKTPIGRVNFKVPSKARDRTRTQVKNNGDSVTIEFILNLPGDVELQGDDIIIDFGVDYIDALHGTKINATFKPLDKTFEINVPQNCPNGYKVKIGKGLSDGDMYIRFIVDNVKDKNKLEGYYEDKRN